VVKEVPVMMPERESAMAITTAAENMCGSKPAATKRRATATEAATVKHRAATMETTAAMEATATVETATTMATAAAVPTLHFGRQSVRDLLRRGHCARIDQRQRFRALAGCRRQHQHRGSRKAQAADDAAPGIRNPSHA
jgi:hypothetical protein